MSDGTPGDGGREGSEDWRLPDDEAAQQDEDLSGRLGEQWPPGEDADDRPPADAEWWVDWLAAGAESEGATPRPDRWEDLLPPSLREDDPATDADPWAALLADHAGGGGAADHAGDPAHAAGLDPWAAFGEEPASVQPGVVSGYFRDDVDLGRVERSRRLRWIAGAGLLITGVVVAVVGLRPSGATLSAVSGTSTTTTEPLDTTTTTLLPTPTTTPLDLSLLIPATAPAPLALTAPTTTAPAPAPTATSAPAVPPPTVAAAPPPAAPVVIPAPAPAPTPVAAPATTAPPPPPPPTTTTQPPGCTATMGFATSAAGDLNGVHIGSVLSQSAGTVTIGYSDGFNDPYPFLTDSAGIAYVPFIVAVATPGSTVTVDVDMGSATCTTSFIAQ